MPIVDSRRQSPFARISARLRGDAHERAERADNVSASGTNTVVAPDGMTRNAVVSGAVERTAGMSLQQVIARAKKAGVPQREQIGPTCGLYALGMVLDSWHEKDPNNATAIVQDADLRGKGKNYSLEPTTHERILDVAQELGFTSMGEMFTARQLAKTAQHFGYEATTHEHATLEDLYKVLDAGHPAIVGFDVDMNGNPGDFGGERAHYAVIQGYFDDDSSGQKTRYLIARHGWAVQKDHVWKADDFFKSWDALDATTYYGTPGDGVIPRHPELKEPAHLDLPAVGTNKAGIYESLARKIVEVVPKGEKPVGGVRA
jgi:Peptidase_C39 like family